MKLKTKKIINICCFSLLILSTISASVAWFVSNKNVEVTSDTELTCEGGNSLEIKMLKQDGTWTDWTKKINEPGPKASMEDITGNGLELHRPTNLEYKNNVLTPTSFEDATKLTDTGGQYIELEVKIRSMSYIDIYFSGESAILPYNLNKPGQLGSSSSPDYIAGAVRVAVIERTPTKDNLKFVWAPNPEYQYDSEKNEVFINSNTEHYEDYKYYGKNPSTGEIKEKDVTVEEYAKKQFVAGSTESNSKWINNSPILTTLDPKNLQQNQYAEAHLVFRIWFEGTDREAVLALSGGHVKVKLNLVGNNSKYNVDEDIRNKMINIKTSGYDSLNPTKPASIEMDNTLFNIVKISADGHNWEKYMQGKDYTSDLCSKLLNKKEDKDNPKWNIEYLYFKYPETADTLEYITRLGFKRQGFIILVDNISDEFTPRPVNKNRPKEATNNEKK